MNSRQNVFEANELIIHKPEPKPHMVRVYPNKNGARYRMQDGAEYFVAGGSIRNAHPPGPTKKQRNKLKREARAVKPQLKPEQEKAS